MKHPHTIFQLFCQKSKIKIFDIIAFAEGVKKRKNVAWLWQSREAGPHNVITCKIVYMPMVIRWSIDGQSMVNQWSTNGHQWSTSGQ